MIDGVTNADALPVLERMVQFAGGRHRLIVNNIANLDTPYFRPLDVSVDAFREQLGEAIDHRREAHGATGGALELGDSREVLASPTRLALSPTPIGDNLLFHDENDRDLERIMQSLTENFMMFRMATEMFAGRMDLINTAIRERV